MSVDGPSVDDVERVLAPQVLHGVTSTDLRHAAEAVHALYAPHLERLASQLEHAALAAAEAGVAVAAASQDAARYREALEGTGRRLAEPACDCESEFGCDYCAANYGKRIAEVAQAIDAALVEPKGQD